MTITFNKLFVLVAIIVWFVVAGIDIVSAPVAHELAWVAVGLGFFGIGALLP